MNKDYVVVKATIKEKGRDKPIVSTNSMSKEAYEKLPEDYFINFWGLNDPDVEWYIIKVLP